MAEFCTYRGCRGEHGHGSPHSLESLDIEQFEATAKQDVLLSLRKRIVNLPQPTLGLAGGISRKDVIDLIDKQLGGN